MLFATHTARAEVDWLPSAQDLSNPKTQWLFKGTERFGKALEEMMGVPDASAMGTVWMGVSIAKSGETTCQVQMSDGNRTLERNALSACRGTRYNAFPSELPTDAVAVRFTMPIRLRSYRGMDYDIPRIRFGCEGPLKPATSMALSEHAVVKLRLAVTALGEVSSHRIVSSSGRADLDGATVEGYSLCSYAAAVKHGKPVAGEIYLEHHWLPDSALNGVPLAPLM
ncbi:hypothetical protein B1810_08145 [Panacagrimonas perspica]|nr:hypothetical protein B1810_08145 [Panacagrimonas perspica]